jgi:hypothetical protein
MAAPKTQFVYTKDEKEDEAVHYPSRDDVVLTFSRDGQLYDFDEHGHHRPVVYTAESTRYVYVVTKASFVKRCGENDDVVVAVEAVYDDGEVAYEHAVMRSFEELGDDIDPIKTEVLRCAVAEATTWVDAYDVFNAELPAAFSSGRYTGATFSVTGRPLQSEFVPSRK